MTGELDPNRKKQDKLPRRQWQATERFANLKLSHWVSAALTLALLVVAVTQALVYFTQAKIMRDQLDVMANEKRPWLRAVVSLGSSITFTDWNGSRGVMLDLKWAIKNYGASPAINVRISPQIVPYLNEFDHGKLDTEEARICAEAMSAENATPVGGFAVFPGDEIPRDTEISISGRSLFKDDPRQLFAVLGCVNYAYADNRHGETGFRYTLGEVADDLVLGILFREGVPHAYHVPPSADLLAHGYPASPPNEARISADHFYFHRRYNGNYAK